MIRVLGGVFLLAINVILLTWIIFDPMNLVASPPSVEAPVEEHRDFWRTYIQEHGGEAAYTLFSGHVADATIDQQHIIAHVIGGLLYSELGKPGLAVCDSSFSFGCYHEFLGRAIHTEGFGVVQELNDACIKYLKDQSLSCQHGIGHGIQTYAGYEQDDLKTALDECRKLPFKDPIGGCYGGAFMEYNQRTMLALDGVGPRSLEENDDPLAPCGTLEKEFQPACYFWQPQWWATNEDFSNPERLFTTIGERCRRIKDDAYKRRCHEGTGNIAPHSASYNPELTISLCQEAAQESAQAERDCRSYAANIFYATPTKQAEAADVCEGLPNGAYTYCIKFSKNIFNQVTQPD